MNTVPARTTGSVITAADFRAQVASRSRSGPGEGIRALGRLPAGKMNGTEARYDEHLLALRDAGQVLWHEFEALKFWLADNTFYTPNFAVMTGTRLIEIHDVKGHWEDDARVKIKVAARLFPFRFLAVQPLPKKAGGGWHVKEF